MRVLPFFPCAENLVSRSEDVNARSIVTEARALVRKSGSSNDNREICGGWRLEACIAVVISGRDGDMQTRLNGVISRRVESL